jgi:DNA-binding IclR family transcriptional regulator
LGSSGRLRILKCLISSPRPLTKYAIQKATGLKSIDVKRDLEKLVSVGWVKVVKSPRAPDKYAIDRDLEEVKALEALFRAAGYV